MSIDQTLSRGYILRECNSKNGKLSFSIKTKTIDDIFFVNSVGVEDRVAYGVGASLKKYGDRIFRNREESVEFLRGVHASLLYKISERIAEVEKELETDLDKWEEECKFELPDDDTIISTIVAGKMVKCSLSSMDSALTFEFRTLTADEYSYVSSVYQLPRDSISGVEATRFKRDILVRGIASVNGDLMSSHEDVYSAIMNLPAQMLNILYKKHSELSGRVDKIMGDDTNF